MNERIREIRTHFGMTLKEFSSKCGFTVSNLSDVERGSTPVQERHIRLILAAFPKVSETWLREGKGEMFVDSGSVEDVLRRVPFEEVLDGMLRAYHSIENDKQEVLETYFNLVLNDLVATNTAAAPAQTKEELLRAIGKELEAEETQAGKSHQSQNTDIPTA